MQCWMIGLTKARANKKRIMILLWFLEKSEEVQSSEVVKMERTVVVSSSE